MCDTCDWTELISKIEDLLDTGRYSFAHETLNGIYETVSENGHATDRQKKAVDNIERSKD